MGPTTKLLDAFDLELAEAHGQRTQEWKDIRAGKFTASEIYKLLTEPRAKADREAGIWSQGAMTYIVTKVAEELTGQVHTSSSAAPLVWGEEMEPQAKDFFTKVTGHEIAHCGFKLFNEHSGGSSDGMVDDGSLIEIKAPYNSANQVEYLNLKKGIEIAWAYPEYWWQMQANMLFNNVSKTYFVTYDPRFISTNHKMKVLDVYANVDDQDLLLKKLTKAIDEKIKIVKSLSA